MYIGQHIQAWSRLTVPAMEDMGNRKGPTPNGGNDMWISESRRLLTVISGHVLVRDLQV